MRDRFSWSPLLLLALMSVHACQDGNSVVDPGQVALTVVGTVTSSATGRPVAGAEVTLGGVAATTAADGRYTLSGVASGRAQLRAVAIGFEDFEMETDLPEFDVTRNFAMARREVYEIRDFSIYVPAGVTTVRGVIVALGGPDTRGFASGTPFGAPIPEVEGSLQVLGERLRALALSDGLAIVGYSRASMDNDPASDQLVFDAIAEASVLSAQPDLATAPLLMYGLSGGAPQASGFTARNPEHVIGLFMKVPAGMETLTGGAALGVPTFAVLAELETVVDNGPIITTFESNRSAGALWALATELGVQHFSLTPRQRELTISWMSAVLERRLPAAASGPIQSIEEASGWLGDTATGRVSAWVSFLGNRGLANWLVSSATADEWEAFVTATGPSAFTMKVKPYAITVHADSWGYLEASVRDETGTLLSLPSIAWSSDREDIAMIGNNAWCDGTCGYVDIQGVAAGVTTITATASSASATATITVLP